jgi:hypothetical protein
MQAAKFIAAYSLWRTVRQVNSFDLAPEAISLPGSDRATCRRAAIHLMPIQSGSDASLF